MNERRIALTRVEAHAFGVLRAAYQRLADAPPHSPRHADCQRRVKDARQRWERALGDLDRAITNPTMTEAA